VKSILYELKGKIERLKEQEDWKKERLQRMEDERKDGTNNK
jgi:hypothetical protein